MRSFLWMVFMVLLVVGEPSQQLKAQDSVAKDDASGLCLWIVLNVPIVIDCELFKSTNGTRHFLIAIDWNLANNLIKRGDSKAVSEQMVSAFVSLLGNSELHKYSATSVFAPTADGSGYATLTTKAYQRCLEKVGRDGSASLGGCIVDAISVGSLPTKRRSVATAGGLKKPIVLRSTPRDLDYAAVAEMVKSKGFYCSDNDQFHLGYDKFDNPNGIGIKNLLARRE
ncbi:MAG: hypothetical protein KAR13_03565 [Desulfobulbaceae bacterium]|nr:hypothetical protein [Desulfobulbaceae bacterium]